MPPTFETVPHLGTTVQAFAGRPASHDELLRRAARRFPRRTALHTPTATLTYAELDAAVTSAATSLRQVAEEGERVAVAMGPGAALFAVPFVASRAGVTVLLLNTKLSPASWADQLRRAAPVAVITDEASRPAAAAAAAVHGHRLLGTAEAWVLDGPGGAAFEDADPDQVLALIGTSGTTGVPKISQVTTSGLIHAAMGYVEVLGLGGEEVSYVCLPLHYIGPLSAQTTTMPLVGGTNVIPADPGATGATARMAAAGVTYVDAVPAWLGMLARDAAVPVPTWRTLIYGGAPMPPDVAATLARRFPGLALWDVWGLSETHGPATALRYDPSAPPMPGIVGRPIPGVEVRTDPAGGIGELLVRGANVTPGYADDPELSATILRGGWLRTGDIGTIGPDGTVRLLDRAKDVILRGGANVFSVEVEQVLAGHPDVVEVAVYGVPDGLGEEAVAATVVLRPGAELDVIALRTMVDVGVGRHAVPRRIARADSLPRNATGKIDKTLLRTRATGHVRPE